MRTIYVNAVGITPDSRYIIVGANDGYAHVLDLATLAEVQSVDLGVGFKPAAMAVDPDGKSVVITSSNSGNVAVLGMDLENAASPLSGIVASVTVGTGSGTEPAITRDGHYAFVANAGANTVSVIDLSASTPAVVGDPLAVGTSPQGVAIADDYGVAFVTNKGSRHHLGDRYPVPHGGQSTKTIAISPATNSITRFAVWRPNRPPTANAGPDQSVEPGATVTLDGSLSSDPDRDHYLTYAWTVTGPDGPVLLSDATDDKPTFIAATAGTYAVQLTVTDPLGQNHTDEEMAVTVVPSDTTPPVITAPTATVYMKPDGSVTVGVDDAVSATYQIDDGTPVTVDRPEGEISIGGTGVFTEERVYTVAVTATDGTNTAGPVTFTVNVDGTAPTILLPSAPVQLPPGGLFEVEVGDDAISATYTVNRDESDRMLMIGNSFTVLPNEGRITIGGNGVFDTAGIYTVSVTATDRVGNEAEPVEIIVSVDATPPIISLAVSPNPVEIGTTVTISASVDDSATGGSAIASVQFTDTLTGMEIPVEFVPLGATASATATTVLDGAGVHTVAVTATDSTGNVATGSVDVVVYDPNGGFVTGGGWIPASDGKATFAFVSKYKAGTASPDGQTKFKLTSSGGDFRSSHYDWLVINGQKAQFAGTGTIDGRACSFTLTAVDNGSDDTFQIHIWDSTGYNYEIGPTGLGGGSIIVHS
jgi:DNA-binding beta-propeller fold protein YncE